MYKNILVPIELDHEEGNQKSFEAARLLADPDAKFTLMYVMEAIPGYVRGQIPDEIFVEQRREVKASLEHFAGEFEGATVHLESGHAGNAILHYADTHDIDCIVVSSHTPKLQKFFLGSTANKVVTHAGCTVLVIR
jgi:nucleotide-binding universal stress UspA family protein